MLPTRRGIQDGYGRIFKKNNEPQ